MYDFLLRVLRMKAKLSGQRSMSAAFNGHQALKGEEKLNEKYKMDLSQKPDFCHILVQFFENSI